MSRNEGPINEFLISNSWEFPKRMKGYFQNHSMHNQKDNSIAAKLMMIDESLPIGRRRVRSESNGRESDFDLYYESKNIKFIVELKAGKVGFRGVAQAVYYNACTQNGHDCVLLMGAEKGPDFDDFRSKCIKEDVWRNIFFLRYADIGLDISKKPGGIAFKSG